jgi:hypothetical protein
MKLHELHFGEIYQFNILDMLNMIYIFNTDQ